MDYQVKRLLNDKPTHDYYYAELVEKIKAKYNSEKYINRWHKRSIDPPQMLFGVLFANAKEYGKKASKIELEMFSSPFTVEMYYYKGYFHELISGQGTAILIYKPEELLQFPLQRKMFYSQALRYIKLIHNDKNYHYDLLAFGFCALFRSAFRLDIYYRCANVIPELVRAKNEMNESHDGLDYWFPAGQWTDRIKCLERAIELCD